MADKQEQTDIPSEIAGLSFEEALAQLEAIVKKLETGESALDDAIEAYERGALLKRHCEAKLRQAQMRVEKISFASDGTPRTEPADAE